LAQSGSQNSTFLAAPKTPEFPRNKPILIREIKKSSA